MKSSDSIDFFLMPDNDPQLQRKANLFNAWFVRLDNARTRTGGGLGLAMVAAVARLHGGELVLSGERGLVATLRLPR